MKTIPEDEQNIVTLDNLKTALNPIEKMFVDRILAVPAKDLGAKWQWYGTDAPSELVKVPNKVFDVPNAKEPFETGPQWYPKAAQADFDAMVAQMKNDIKKEIWNDSGYRSPGKQAYLFIKYLADDSEDGNKYSLTENAKWVTMPGYSEHGYGKTPAFDFALNGGDSLFLKPDGKTMSNEESAALIEQSDEYKWMVANASKYHFVLSYPRNNPLGMGFEPWHWRWEGGK